MPFTTIKVIEGVFTDEQKADMIQKVTEAMIEVEGQSMRDLTWVTIEEVKKGDWAIVGVCSFEVAGDRRCCWRCENR